MTPTLVEGWADIQSSPKRAARAQKLLRGAEKWNPAVGNLVKYLAEFITLSCAPDMLAMNLFPNGKEISESFGAYNAARYRLPEFALDDRRITLIAVGDGRTPRTAATFAMRTAWDCHSVDPVLKGGVKRWAAIKRLTLHNERVERVRINAERAIVVAVHSHARLQATLPSINAAHLAVIAIPCCVPMTLPQSPDLEYQDKSIISPCRTVKIWRNVSR